MKTWMKYILVTVPPSSLVLPNNRVAIYFPTNGDELLMLIPIVAAQNAKASHGRR